jgi:hypothetical protein
MMIIRQLEKGVVPDVIGLSRQMAKERVAGVGLKPAFSFAEGFVEADDPGLESMRVTAQSPSAGTKIEGEGEVAMVLIRSDGSSDAGQPEPPPETTTDTQPPDDSNSPTQPLDLGGAWTGELVITDVTDTPPEGCDVSLLEKGKPFPIKMDFGAPNEQGEGQLTVAGAQENGEPQKETIPFSYNPQDGTIRFSQSKDGMTITFEGRCAKSENGNVMEGTFSLQQGGQTIFSGDWKQTQATP